MRTVELKSVIEERLKELRKNFKKKRYDGVFINGQNEYLDEELEKGKNEREYLTGFTGSKGELLILEEEGYLYVDSRYHEQAKEEVKNGVEAGALEVVCIEGRGNYFEEMVKNIGGRSLRIGTDGGKMSYGEYEAFKKVLVKNKGDLMDMGGGLGLRMGNEERRVELERVENEESEQEKYEGLREWMRVEGYDFVVISQLDDLSYLCNLRDYGREYDASVEGLGLIGQEKGYVFLKGGRIELGGSFEVYEEGRYWEVIGKVLKGQMKSKVRVGIDFRQTSMRLVKGIEDLLGYHGELVDTNLWITEKKKVKNRGEIEAMEEGVRRTDKVLEEVMDWVNEGVLRGDKISEAGISEKVKGLIKEQGGKGLSFKMIVARGKNAQKVHYTKNGDKEYVGLGDLVLIDAGGYFEGGYATDLTRTFKAGYGGMEGRMEGGMKGSMEVGSEKEKEIYSIILKASIKVMSLRFPMGTRWSDIDMIGRSILWEYGYHCPHSIGHGIGVRVHEESGMRKDKKEDMMSVGMIFTVEPGVYIEGFGGIRIENVVIVEEDKEWMGGWLRFRVLSYARLEEYLIDRRYMDKREIGWLRGYKRRGRI